MTTSQAPVVRVSDLVKFFQQFPQDAQVMCATYYYDLREGWEPFPEHWLNDAFKMVYGRLYMDTEGVGNTAYIQEPT